MPTPGERGSLSRGTVGARRKPDEVRSLAENEDGESQSC